MTSSPSDATPTVSLKSQGIFPCNECAHSRLHYKLDDFHMNAQCYSPKNMSIKMSPVTFTSYPEFKAQFCKDTRSNLDLCGPKGVWFEPNKDSLLPIVEETKTAANAESKRESLSGNGDQSSKTAG